MSKRRKPGNVNPKSRFSKGDNPYYLREKEINRKLNLFSRNYYNMDLKDEDNYWVMFDLRMEIKTLLRQQEDLVWVKSINRRMAYFDQLSKFKFIYSRWKKATYPIFVKHFGA